MNIAALLEKSARSFPGRPALTVGTDVRADYAAFHTRVAGLAGALRRDIGLAEGERVGIAMANAPAFYEALFAAWHAGLVAVPMNAKLHADEFAFIVENSGQRAVFADAKLEATFAPLARASQCLSRVLVTSDPSYEEMAGGARLALQDRPADSPAWLFYTSGTTGHPKGAMLTHRNLLMMTLSYFADLGCVAPEDGILHAAPMSHGSGLYGLPHVAKAANNVIPESGGFAAEEVFALIRAHPGLTIFAAPTMVVRLLNSAAAGGDTRNLKLLCYGGGPMYVADTERALAAFGPKLAQIYGQGESPMTITSLSREMHDDRGHPCYRARLSSVGIARTDVEVRILDADDRPLPPGEAGEVVVRGEVVMPGYWENPAATAEALRGGWLHTGDIGVMDEHGFLTLKDRSKDLIISGGANIYPREIEEILLCHPAVLEAAVIGRPHSEWGEEVVAFVVVRPGQAVEAEELDAYCLAHLARFKRPRAYMFETALPKNNYGKILKRSLRERFLTRP